MNTFDGKTYNEARDKVRLSTQLGRVLDVLKFNSHAAYSESLTLTQIAEKVKAPESSVSARLRDLRKPKFGGHDIQKRNCGGGKWVYWLRFAQPKAPIESKPPTES